MARNEHGTRTVIEVQRFVFVLQVQLLLVQDLQLQVLELQVAANGITVRVDHRNFGHPFVVVASVAWNPIRHDKATRNDTKRHKNKTKRHTSSAQQA